MELSITGLNKIIRKLRKVKDRLDSSPKKVLQMSASEGTTFAQQIAPKATGALVTAITFYKSGEMWIIASKQPKKKEYNYPGKREKTTKKLPYHIWIEKGIQKAKTGKNAYMEKTANMLRKKLFNKFNAEVEYAIRD